MYEIAEDVPRKVLTRLTSWHHGQENGISAARLAGQLGMTEREVRRAVAYLREEGSPICAHPKRGYFYPATREEMEETLDFLHKRSLHSLRLESQMRRIALPELMGQLQLEFTEAVGPELREE